MRRRFQQIQSTRNKVKQHTIRNITAVTNITNITKPVKPVLPSKAPLEDALIKMRVGLALRMSDDDCVTVKICEIITVCVRDTVWLCDFVLDAVALGVCDCVELCVKLSVAVRDRVCVRLDDCVSVCDGVPVAELDCESVPVH